MGTQDVNSKFCTQLKLGISSVDPGYTFDYSSI